MLVLNNENTEDGEKAFSTAHFLEMANLCNFDF